MANESSEQKKVAIAAAEESVKKQMQKVDSAKTTVTQPEIAVNSYSKPDWWTAADAMTISSAVLIFGCVIMFLATYLLYKGKNADDVLKLFGTIIIVISAVFLVVAGYTDTQISPVIGLLGTIAGYLLGSKSAEEESISVNKTAGKKNTGISNKTTEE